MPPIDCSNAPSAVSPRVVASYAHTLWDAARAQGVSQALLEQTFGRPVVGEGEVSVPAYLALLQQALQHAGPLFGWRLGQSVKPTTYSVNGILLLACPTLGDALQQVLRFESLVHDLGRSSLERQGDAVVYAWRNDSAGHPAAGALTESVFSGIQTCAQWLLGQGVSGFALDFMHRTDEASAAAIAAASGAQVRWGAPANRAVFFRPRCWTGPFRRPTRRCCPCCSAMRMNCCRPATRARAASRGRCAKAFRVGWGRALSSWPMWRKTCTCPPAHCNAA